jgi:hypothetical protein
MKDHAENPCSKTKVSKKQIVSTKWIAGWHFGLELAYTVIVCEKVEQREEHREWFLHSHKAMKRPFSMELKNRLSVWRISGHTLISHNVLAGVIAFGGTGPEEDTAVERY